MKPETKKWSDIADDDYDTSQYLFKAPVTPKRFTSYNTKAKVKPIMEVGEELYQWLKNQFPNQ